MKGGIEPLSLERRLLLLKRLMLLSKAQFIVVVDEEDRVFIERAGVDEHQAGLNQQSEQGGLDDDVPLLKIGSETFALPELSGYRADDRGGYFG